MEAANAFLAEFIVKFNKKFGVKASDPESAFRELEPEVNIDFILCQKEERQIIANSGFSFNGKYYQLYKNGKKAKSIPKAKITVLTSSKIGIKASYAGVVYDTNLLDERPKVAVKSVPNSESKKAKHVPAKDHPWRNSGNEKPIPPLYESFLLRDETDHEIQELLNSLFNSTRAWV